MQVLLQFTESDYTFGVFKLFVAIFNKINTMRDTSAAIHSRAPEFL